MNAIERWKLARKSVDEAAALLSETEKRASAARPSLVAGGGLELCVTDDYTLRMTFGANAKSPGFTTELTPKQLDALRYFVNQTFGESPIAEDDLKIAGACIEAVKAIARCIAEEFGGAQEGETVSDATIRLLREGKAARGATSQVAGAQAIEATVTN